MSASYRTWICRRLVADRQHLHERHRPGSTPEIAQVGEGILRQLPANDYPHLVEMMVDHAMKPGYDYSDEFEFGLDLILDGLERLRDTA
jgi:hypothetical protein